MQKKALYTYTLPLKSIYIWIHAFKSTAIKMSCWRNIRSSIYLHQEWFRYGFYLFIDVSISFKSWSIIHTEKLKINYARTSLRYFFFFNVLSKGENVKPAASNKNTFRCMHRTLREREKNQSDGMLGVFYSVSTTNIATYWLRLKGTNSIDSHSSLISWNLFDEVLCIYFSQMMNHSCGKIKWRFFLHRC